MAQQQLIHQEVLVLILTLGQMDKPLKPQLDWELAHIQLLLLVLVDVLLLQLLQFQPQDQYQHQLLELTYLVLEEIMEQRRLPVLVDPDLIPIYGPMVKLHKQLQG